MIRRSYAIIVVAAAVSSLIALAIATGVYLRRGSTLEGIPRPGDKTYIEMVSAFYSGVAALDVDAKDRAKTAGLTCATVLFAGEPPAGLISACSSCGWVITKRLRGIWIRPQSWRRKTARSSAF